MGAKEGSGGQGGGVRPLSQAQHNLIVDVWAQMTFGGIDFWLVLTFGIDFWCVLTFGGRCPSRSRCRTPPCPSPLGCYESFTCGLSTKFLRSPLYENRNTGFRVVTWARALARVRERVGNCVCVRERAIETERERGRRGAYVGEGISARLELLVHLPVHRLHPKLPNLSTFQSSKVDRFVPRTQHVDFEIVCQSD